jgi:GT2 family glycosyltransferase
VIVPPNSISFVIPVKNDAARLRRCLTSIANARTGQTRVECIVADNESVDDTAQSARRLGAEVVGISGSPVSRVRNAAAASASGELLAFVDADHEISNGWIAAAMQTMADETVGGTGALCLPPPGGTRVQALYGSLRGRTIGQSEVTWLGSGNLVVRRSVFDALGGFDERLHTCEDVDLCQRLLAAGWRLIGDERLVNYHLGDPATLLALFTSERWRGRDNLRVSLRRMPSLRDWPSILIPIAGALSLLAVPAGLLWMLFSFRTGLGCALVAIAVIAGLSGLRAMRMIARGAAQKGSVGLILAVAVAYDLGRACSLLLPAGHRDRQRVERHASRPVQP